LRATAIVTSAGGIFLPREGDRREEDRALATDRGRRQLTFVVQDRFA